MLARQTSKMSQHSELSFLHDKCHNINLNINNKRQITTNVIEVFQVRPTNVINVIKWPHQVIIMLCEQQTLVYLPPVGYLLFMETEKWIVPHGSFNRILSMWQSSSMFNSCMFCLLMLGEWITLYFTENGTTIVTSVRVGHMHITKAFFLLPNRLA